MIRLLLRLFGIKDYEVCQSCETLKQQLEFERSEKRQLTETLLSILKPKTYEAPPVEVQPIVNSAGLFSRRRAALEARDRAEAQIIAEKKHLAVPDDALRNKNIKSVEELEQELGVSEEKTS